ncbi:UDP-N-acetylglucosamine 1-carboxyvinyltransferase [bacterium]|nr:UDP-N-acetylglucosamine 1-carboxyvinyltransferase [bacterium]
MDKLIVNGGPPLVGTIPVSGAKNSALPILAAAILSQGDCHITNVPELTDVHIICEILRTLGVEVESTGKGSYRLNASGLCEYTAPYELVTKMRAAFFAIGPILARMGHARIPLPGGCTIGSRPVDLHLKGLRSLGAKVTIEHGYVEAQADALIGGNIYLDFPSVGATETIMMAAVHAEGTTVIENCAQEPEIVDLADFLNKMGAKVTGAGTQTITVEGVRRLGGCEHAIIPDRIEAGTFMVAAAITRGDLTLTGVRNDHLQAIASKLIEMGVTVTPMGEDVVNVKVEGPLKPVDIRTMPHPGFPTDMQAQIMTLLATIDGTSVLTEMVFENRFLHVDELIRMGANIKAEGNVAVIQGVPELSGAPVKATDLRAGAAMILAGLVGRGETVITGLQHIDRGYEHIEAKLTAVGARISRTSRPETVLTA